jgi:hypothetical protein
MHSKEGQKTSRCSAGVRKFQQGEGCVLIAIILSSFFRRIRQVCARATISVTTVDSNVPKSEGTRRKTCVRALHSEHGTLHDRIRRFVDIAQRCDLWEKVLGVSTGTCVLVRADDRYISVAVDTGKEPGQFGDDGTPDTAVPEGYVYVPVSRQKPMPDHSDVTWAMSSKSKTPCYRYKWLTDRR